MIGDKDKTPSTTTSTEVKTETTPKERVMLELKDLKDKILKLTAVLYGDSILEKGIRREQICMMEDQLRYMQGYAAILQNRLSHWDDTQNNFFHDYHNFH